MNRSFCFFCRPWAHGVMIFRWCWFVLIGLGGGLVSGAAPAPGSAGLGAAGKPNIIFILADDMGYGDVKSLNPQGKIPTPYIDTLAAQGMAFTQAHSTSAVCTPSRYSILTGRYSWRSTMKQSVLGGFSPPLIEANRLTVAEYLRRNGYATTIIGKWHLGLDWVRRPESNAKATPKARGAGANPGRDVDFTKPFARGPLTLGFEEFFGISASLDMPPYVYLEGDRMQSAPSGERTFPWVGVAPAGEQTRLGPAAEGFEVVNVLPDFTRRAVEVIGRQAAAARSGKPFFLYLPLASPHTPLAPAKEWRGKSGLNDYADFVMQTDAAVGKILAALDQHGLAQNTLIIFTSDNGCSPEANFQFLNGHGHDPNARRRGYKADIFDGGTHVPFLVRWPARVLRGRSTDALVSLGDFMATCADIVGVPLPETAGEDSVSFLPVLLGKSGVGPRQTLVTHSANGSFAIRQGRWKLALCADSGGWSFPRPGQNPTTGAPRFQLYNLYTDPAEVNNVVAENPDVVRRLGVDLRDIVNQGRSTPGPVQKNATVTRWPQIEMLDEFK